MVESWRDFVFGSLEETEHEPVWYDKESLNGKDPVMPTIGEREYPRQPVSHPWRRKMTKTGIGANLLPRGSR